MHGILAHICVILRVYNTWKICSKLTVFHSCIYPSSSRSACHWHLAHDGKTVRPSCPLVVLVGFVVFVFSFGVCSYLSDSIGYQPHWLCLSLVFLKGITFDWGFGVPVKPLAHESPLTFPEWASSHSRDSCRACCKASSVGLHWPPPCRGRDLG